MVFHMLNNVTSREWFSEIIRYLNRENLQYLHRDFIFELCHRCG